LTLSRSTCSICAGVGFQLALDHQPRHVLDQPDHGFFELLVLLGQRRQQAAHQPLKAADLGA
jgi:hypothetical protein